MARQWTRPVVPHAGDVDRNARDSASFFRAASVVPHAGDVDRNIMREKIGLVDLGRPPRGGRG